MARPEKDDRRHLLSRIAGGAGERMLKAVDPNVVLDQVDPDQLLERVDVDALLDRVDVDRLLDRVDVDRLLDRVDVDRLLDRVDVDRLLDRVDPGVLIGRADIDTILQRVDVRAVVERAGIPEIVAESTSHLTGSALDLVRRPLVGLDEIIFRSANRLVGRDPATFPEGPGELVEWVDRRDGSASGVMTGRYAGPLTRLLAAIVDLMAITASFTLMAGGVEFLTDRFITGFSIVPEATSLLYGILLGIWGFLYFVVGLALVGKTPGKALLGLRVVTDDGNPGLHGRQPLLRVLSYPLSFILLLGFIGVVFGRERRAWHDRIAGTAVVYDWGSRTATLPTPLAKYLERRQRGESEEIIGVDPSVT
jgi:uncharacterized RDD family membrane protein YckC